MALAVLPEANQDPRSCLYQSDSAIFRGGMSYNPAPLSSAGVSAAEVDSISPQGDRIPEPSPGPLSPTISHLQAIKKRRPSKIKPSEIRRSASTPQMRGLALADVGALSPTTDKRRNKLGYHRTSVACGHCRRRKIRCLLAADDPQGRCSNCIRLKKECNFYPVEQQPPASESRLGGSVNKHDTGSGAPTASTPSSPRASVTSVHEQGDEFTTPYNNNLSRASTQNVSSLEGTPMGAPPEGVIYPPPAYGYPPRMGEQQPQQWTPGSYPAQSPLPDEPPASGTYWSPPAGTEADTIVAYPSVGEAQSWSAPTRSMSYGHLEGLQQQQYAQAQYGTPQRYPVRSNTYTYAPNVNANERPMNPNTMSPASSVPVTAYSTYGYNATWAPYTMQDPSVPIPDGQPAFTGQWYGEPAQLGQVDEEQIPGAHYHNMQPSFFSNQQKSA